MALRPLGATGPLDRRRGGSEVGRLAPRDLQRGPDNSRQMAPFGSIFSGADPFQEFSSSPFSGGLGGSMMSRFDNIAAEMMRGFPSHGEMMKGFSSDVPGGSYSCQTYAMSSVMGKDGKMHTEKFASSDVGNPQHGIREAQHAYSNSSSGVDKMGLERHLGDRARKMVKERNRLTMEEKSSEMFRGMDEGGRDHFDKDFSGLSRHLPPHGRGGIGAFADTGRGPAMLPERPSRGTIARRQR